MKNLIIGLLCVVFLSIMMAGCNKSTPPEIDNNNNNNDQTEEVQPPNEDNRPEDNTGEETEPTIPQPQPEVEGNSTIDPSQRVSYRYFLIRTDGAGFASPSATMCKSPEDMLKYRELISTGYEIGDESSQWSFYGFTKKYNEEFFKDNTVLFILLDESNSNIVHRVSTVGMDGSDLIVDIIRENTETEASSSAQWNIAVELPKTVVDAENFIINLI